MTMFRRTNVLAIAMTAGLALTPAVLAQQDRTDRQRQQDRQPDREQNTNRDRLQNQPRVTPGNVDRVDVVTARFLPLTLAKDMEDAEIKGSDGETIGRLRDMIVHARTGEINIALIGRGGVGSLGETYYGVPVETLRWNPAEKQFAAPFTAEQLKNAKGLDDKDDWAMFVGEAHHSQTTRALGLNNSRHWQSRLTEADRYTESFKSGKVETMTGEVIAVERSNDPQTRGDHVIRLKTERGDTVRVIADSERTHENWRDQGADNRQPANRGADRTNTRDDRNALPDNDRAAERERERQAERNPDRVRETNRDRDQEARNQEGRNQEGRNQEGMNRGDWTAPAYLPREGQKITVKGVPTTSSEGRTIVASHITTVDDNRTRQYRNEEGRPWWRMWDSEDERIDDMHMGHVLLSDIRDANVITSDGESVGELEDIGIEPASMTIGMTTVEVGGVLGLGGEKVIVPMPAFRFNEDMNLQIAKTKAQLEAAPKVKVEGGDEHFGPVLVQAESYRFYNVPLPSYDRGPAGNPAQNMRDRDGRDRDGREMDRARTNDRDNANRDNEAWRQMRAGGTPVNIAGQIESIDRNQSIKSLGEGVVITLNDGNKDRTVHLGHRERLDGLGVKLNDGDQVNVRGAEVTLDGKVFVLAESITVNGRTFEIRTQEMAPPANRNYNPDKDGAKDGKDRNDPKNPR